MTGELCFNEKELPRFPKYLSAFLSLLGKYIQEDTWMLFYQTH